MLPIQDIIQTAITEHEDTLPSKQEYIKSITSSLESGSISRYTKLSKPLSLVRFKCLLQDTGYPMEVYLPGQEGDDKDGKDENSSMDWNLLKERWVGWGVEIPGEQSWSNGGDSDLVDELHGLSVGPSSKELPKGVHGKYPLPGRGGDYLGALVKVYDDISFKPASVHTFIGILSTSSLPSPDTQENEETATIVPTIHVLSYTSDDAPSQQPTTPEGDLTTRSDLIPYLSTAFSPPDITAAEYLLLLLLSTPSSRPQNLPPLGTLTVNFLHPSSPPTNLIPIISTLLPYIIPIQLTLPLLHSHPFSPASSDGSNLTAGLLQLAPGSLVVVEEDYMGDGGVLQEKAIKNLEDLKGVMEGQSLRYSYPYMEGLKMETNILVAVVSEGKSLLPVDIHIPLLSTSSSSTSSSTSNTPPTPTPEQVLTYRQYLTTHILASQTQPLKIPEETATSIQQSFIQDRQSLSIEVAEEKLKRRMKVARLCAVSVDGVLGGEVWEKVLRLEGVREGRMEERERERREKRLGKEGLEV